MITIGSTIGTHRRIAQCSDDAHTFSILAIDHRDNLMAELQKHREAPVRYQDMVAFKRDVASLSGEATAILLDPDYGMPSVVDGTVPGHVGLLAPLEVTDYRPHPSARKPRMIPDWSVACLSRAGVSGAKLLLYYHPDAPDADENTALVDRLVEDCRSHDIPLFLEPIAFSPDAAAALSPADHRRVVVETARHFSGRGVSVMKVEFPLPVSAAPDERVWAEALAELDAACAGPWALLSAGVSYDVFVRQTILACQAGASGVIAGRAVWKEAVALDDVARATFMRDVARRRLQRLAGICRALARPWTERVSAPAAGERWYVSRG